MFTRRRRPPSDVRHLSLAAGADRDGTLTKIDNPDLLTPIPHSLPRLDPHDTDLRGLVTRVVEAIAGRGGIDEFTVDVLDGWLERERDTWVAQVRETAQQRRFVAATIVNQHTQNAETARVSLATLRENRARFAAEYASACADAGLPGVSPAPNSEAPRADGSSAQPFAFLQSILAGELLAEPPLRVRPAHAQDPAAVPATDSRARSTAGIDNIADFPSPPTPSQAAPQSPAHIQNGELR